MASLSLRHKLSPSRLFLYLRIPMHRTDMLSHSSRIPPRLFRPPRIHTRRIIHL